jgi:hypothetical protein
MIGICELCKKNAKLQISHIVPKFVVRWFKESTTGGIRTNRKPNLRVQDFYKTPLLCADCEQLFSIWEKSFYENVFLPLHNPEPVTKSIHYGYWALKFAVSVSWRVLVFFEKEKSVGSFSADQKQLIRDARETWERFLLGELDDPGIYNQHILPLDVIEDYNGQRISPYLNRYLLRTIHIDMISTRGSIYTYTKMCRVVIFGRIQDKQPKLWRGSQLHLMKGEIKKRDYQIPNYFFTYMNNKADEAKRILESISPKQQKAIDSMFEMNINAIADSELFRAMNYDIYHSGGEAFSKMGGKGN